MLEHNDQRALCSRTVKTIISMSIPYQITRAALYALLVADCDDQMAKGGDKY